MIAFPILMLLYIMEKIKDENKVDEKKDFFLMIKDIY